MKKQFILICSLFLILSISSVCASDDFIQSDSDTLSSDNSDINLDLSENEDLLSANDNESGDAIITAPDITKYFGGNERFNVTLLDSNSNPISNESVTIKINGVNYNRITNSNGVASIALNLRPGEYPVTSSYKIHIINSTVTVLDTINGTDIVKMEKNDTQYYATFRDGKGNYLANGTTIQFNINGVLYNRQINGNEGLARLNINLGSGDYIITALNLITGEMKSNNITVISKFGENRDIVKYFKNATQYTLKVYGNDGKPAVGENVTFNINGVFYDRTVNSSGICKLNINLAPGDYVISAQYLGSIVSNNIKVLPILYADDLVKYYGHSEPFVATLLDGQGKLYPNQDVMFNINGVLYHRTTNASGQVKLNINLFPAEYIITSMFNGSAISNKVIVKPVTLSVYDIAKAANDLNAYYEKNGKFPATIKAPFYGFTMPEFFYLMNKAISQLGSSNYSDIKIIDGVKGPDSTSAATTDSCLLKKDEFVSIANNLSSQIAKDNKVPSTVDTPMGKLSFNDYLLISTRVMSFFWEYDADLADYVTVISQDALKNINNPYGISGKNVYIDADGGSDDKKWDLARALTAAGWNVKVGETDSNSHYKDYFNTPANYVLINIYNGFCAGTIRELASSYIQNVLKSKNVVCVPVWDTINWTNPDGMGPYRYGDFTGYSAQRAWDDNFSINDPYISNVAQYLSSNNIKHCSYPSTEGLVYQFLHGGAVATMK